MYDFQNDQFFTDSKDHPANEPLEEMGSTTDEEDSDEQTNDKTSATGTPIPGEQRLQAQRKMLSQKKSTLKA